MIRCPYGRPGDLLWVKEAWRAGDEWDEYPPSEIEPGSAVWYEADGFCSVGEDGWGRLRSCLHLPKNLASLWLRVTDVRVERVQEISEDDAYAEGVRPGFTAPGIPFTEGFATLWDTINARRGYPWANNDWVWVVVYEMTEAPG
jgi:hypothetical protein